MVQVGQRATLVDRWPTALALAGGAAAVLVIAQRDTETFSVVVVMMAGIYLLAYAIGRQWTAWLAVVVFSAVLAVLQVLDDEGGLAVDPGVAMSAAVVLVWLWAVARHRFTDGGMLWLQTAGMVGFGAITLAGVVAAPRWAALLAGVGFLAHGAWDVYHYRIDKVVHRSYAECCAVFDLVIGPALIVAALTQT
jgi:hypothetical protein